MFYIAKVFSNVALNVILFFGKRVFLFILFGLIFLFSIVYISYPYVKISVREKNTSKYLQAIENLYEKKDKTKDDLLVKIKKQTDTNKLLLLLKFLPEVKLSDSDKQEILKKVSKLNGASPVVYDFLILKLSDFLIEKGNASCVSYLEKISKGHPCYEIAQKKIVKFFLMKKDFKKAETKIAFLEKNKINVDKLKETLIFLKKN